jgi:polyferredoxin
MEGIMDMTIVKIVFAIAAALWLFVFGRLFCGKACPVGIAQDLLHKIPFPKKIKTFKADKNLRYIKYGMLLVMLGSTLFGFSQDTEEETLSLAVMIAFISIAGLICIMVSRPFCKYFCLAGAVSGLGNKLSFYKYRINHEKCVHCGLCAKVCPMNIDPLKTNALECIRCGRCGKSCPKSAITSGFDRNHTYSPS